MHTQSYSRNTFKLENLEPRLLLSADGVLGSAAEELYPPLEDATDAILMDFEAAVEADVEKDVGLFDVPDEAISTVDSDADTTPGDPAPDSAGIIYHSESISGQSEESLLGSGREDPARDSISGQLVTTLHAANAPPQADSQLVAVDEPDCLVRFENGVVFVIGNDDANKISIVEKSGLVSVQCDDGPLHEGEGITGIEVVGQAGADTIMVELDGTGIRSVKIDAGAGNDLLRVNLGGEFEELNFTAHLGEGDDIAEWFETLAKAEKSHVAIFGEGGADQIIMDINIGAGLNPEPFREWVIDGGEGDDVLSKTITGLQATGAFVSTIKAGDGDDTVEVHQQINQITSFIDGSVVYDTGDGNDTVRFTMFLEDGTPLRGTMNVKLKLGAGDDLAALDMRGDVQELNTTVETGSGADQVALHLEQGAVDNALIHDVKLAKLDLPDFDPANGEPADGLLTVRSTREAGVDHLDTQWLGASFGDTTLSAFVFLNKADLVDDVDLEVQTGDGNDNLTVDMDASVRQLLFRSRADLGGGTNESTTVLEFTNAEPMPLDIELFFDTYEGKDNIIVLSTLDGIVEQGRFNIQANTRGGDDEVHTGFNFSRAYPLKWEGPSLNVNTGGGNDAVQLVVNNADFKANIDLGEGDNHFEARLSNHGGKMKVTSGAGDDSIVSRAEWTGESIVEHPDFAWLPTYNTGGGTDGMQLFFQGKLKVSGDPLLDGKVDALLNLGDGNDQAVIDLSQLTLEGATRDALFEFKVDGGLGDDDLTVALPAVQNPDPSEGGEDPEPIDPAERRAPVSVRNISGPGLDRILLVGTDATEYFDIHGFPDALEQIRTFELNATDLATANPIAEVGTLTVTHVAIDAAGGDDVVNLNATIPAHWDFDLGEGDNTFKGNFVGGVPPEDNKPAEFRVIGESGNDLIELNMDGVVPPDEGIPRTYVVKIDAGDGNNETLLRFGDGEPGRVPPADGSGVRAGYRSGSGADSLTIHYTGLELTDLDIDAVTGAGDDVSEIMINGTVENAAINLDLGDGDDTSIRALTGVIKHFDLIAKLGDGHDKSSLSMDGVLNANVNIDGGTGDDFVNVGSFTSFTEVTGLNAPITHELTIDTGDGDDVVIGSSSTSAGANGSGVTDDDRNFSELKVVIHTGLGRDSAEWTDFNTHDPGITLVRLIDFLADLGAGDDRVQVEVLGAATEQTLNLIAKGDEGDDLIGLALFAPSSPSHLTANLTIDAGLGADKVSVDWVDRLGADAELDLTVDIAPGGVGFVLPEVSDEVVVAFEHGDIRAPIIIGALWNGKDAPPESNGDSNGTGIHTSSLYFNVHTVPSAPSVQFDLQGGAGEDSVDLTMVGDVELEIFNVKVDGGEGADTIQASLTDSDSSANDVAIEELVLAVERFEVGVVSSLGFAYASVLLFNDDFSLDFTGQATLESIPGSVNFPDLKITMSTADGDESEADLDVQMASFDNAVMNVDYFKNRLLNASDFRIEIGSVVNLDFAVNVVEDGQSDERVRFIREVEGEELPHASSTFKWSRDNGSVSMHMLDGESQANRRYLYFAKVADIEGNPISERFLAMNIRPLQDRVLVHRIEAMDNDGLLSAAVEGIAGQAVTDLDLSCANHISTEITLSVEAARLDSLTASVGHDSGDLDLTAEGPVVVGAAIAIPNLIEARSSGNEWSGGPVSMSLSHSASDTDGDGTPDFVDADTDGDGWHSLAFDGRFLTAADLKTEFMNVGEVKVNVEAVGPDGQLSQISTASSAGAGRHMHTGQYNFLLELAANGAVQHLDAHLNLLGTADDDNIMLDVQGEADILGLALEMDAGAGKDTIGLQLNVRPRVSTDIDAKINLGDGDDLLNATMATGLAESLDLSLDVLGGDGDDTALLKWTVPPEPIFPPEPILIGDVLIDMGAGNDEAEFEFEMLTGNNTTPQLDVHLLMLGGTGRDNLSAKAEFDGPVTGSLDMRLLGGDDGDVLRLRARRLPTGLDAFLLIDGGNGIDRCFGGPGVTEINCER